MWKTDEPDRNLTCGSAWAGGLAAQHSLVSGSLPLAQMTHFKGLADTGTRSWLLGVEGETLEERLGSERGREPTAEVSQ